MTTSKMAAFDHNVGFSVSPPLNIHSFGRSAALNLTTNAAFCIRHRAPSVRQLDIDLPSQYVDMPTAAVWCAYCFHSIALFNCLCRRAMKRNRPNKFTSNSMNVLLILNEISRAKYAFNWSKQSLSLMHRLHLTASEDPLSILLL